LTLRKLIWMAEARRRDAWDHTANLMALTANINRDPKQRREPFTAGEFHPFGDRRAAEKDEERTVVKDWSLVRKAWKL
jgi:hypothetical protein